MALEKIRVRHVITIVQNSLWNAKPSLVVNFEVRDRRPVFFKIEVLEENVSLTVVF